MDYWLTVRGVPGDRLIHLQEGIPTHLPSPTQRRSRGRFEVVTAADLHAQEMGVEFRSVMEAYA